MPGPPPPPTPAGLLLLVAGETQFHLIGFVMVMSAAMLSGFRWTLTQILLQPQPQALAGGEGGGDGSEKAKQECRSEVPISPVVVMYRLLPVMSGTVALMSLISEKVWVSLPETAYFSTAENAALTFLMIFFGGVLAFSMVWAEFKVIQETSAMTFTVAGTFKEVVTIVASVFIFGDEFHLINGFGLFVLMIGVGLFNYIKLVGLRKGTIRAKPLTTNIKSTGTDVSP